MGDLAKEPASRQTWGRTEEHQPGWPILHPHHSRQIWAPTHASSLPQREGEAQLQRTCLEKEMSVQNSCTRYPETQRAGPSTSHWGGGAFSGILAAGAPHSPKRSSTVHTSARRPPGAGEVRSGALQERPARKSRACTYSRPSALAWATSSLSVGERSKASMISAAKTEERRSTSMAEAQARGTTPTTDKAQPDGLQPSGEGTPTAPGDLEARREAQRSPPRAPGSSADPELTEGLGAALKRAGC